MQTDYKIIMMMTTIMILMVMVIDQKSIAEAFQRERELRTQNSELYYSRIKILYICLFLQSVLANLHANT